MLLRSFAKILALVFGLLSGCSYHAGSGPRRLPDGYKYVAVPVFRNMTQYVGFEVPMTNAMVREIERNHIANSVDKESAEVILDGQIDAIDSIVTNQIDSTSPGNPVPKNTVLNSGYRLIVKIHLQLKRSSDQKIIWDERFEKEQSYFAPKIGIEGLNSANALYNQSARNDTLAAIAADLAVEAHTRLTENF